VPYRTKPSEPSLFTSLSNMYQELKNVSRSNTLELDRIEEVLKETSNLSYTILFCVVFVQETSRTHLFNLFARNLRTQHKLLLINSLSRRLQISCNVNYHLLCLYVLVDCSSRWMECGIAFGSHLYFTKPGSDPLSLSCTNCSVTKEFMPKLSFSVRLHNVIH